MISESLVSLITDQAVREWGAYAFYQNCSFWANLAGWPGAEGRPLLCS